MKQLQPNPGSVSVQPTAYPTPQPAGHSGQQAVPPPQLVPQGQAPNVAQQPYPAPAQGAAGLQNPQHMTAPAPVQPGMVPQSQPGMPPPMPEQAAPAQPMPGAPGDIMESVAPVVGSVKEGGEKALPRIAIHGFCERPDSAGALQATTQDWRMGRANLKIYMGGLTAAIEYYRNESTPSLILFESGLRGEELFAQLDALASVCDAGTKVVMMGAMNDIRLFRALMDKGLSDYIVPPFHPLSIIRSISDLYSDPDKPFTGRVVAFFGAKGGVGSSTLAHNIAWGLANKMGQETALVDMDSSWGTAGLDFHFDNVQGLEEALADSDRLDETLLDRIMVRHSDKLSILPASASLGAPAPTSPEAYEALVNGVRSLSPLTLLDMPHIWTEWTSQILQSADDVVITATPGLANLRNAKNLVDFLKASRPNDADPLLVVNKTGVPKTAEIPVKDFAAAIGLQPAVVLPYEPIIYTEASNEGKMLSDISAAAPAFEGMMYLAHRLRTGQFPVQTRAKKGGRFKKLKPSKNKDGRDGNEKKSSGGSLFSKLKKRK